MTTKVHARMVASDVATQAELDAVAASAALKKPGDTVQIVSLLTQNMGANAATIPKDNTIPQVGEGAQFLSTSITPQAVANLLRVRAVLCFSSSNAANVTAALFRDGAANAIAAAAMYCPAGQQSQVVVETVVAAGSTSATTFTLRAGGDVATTVTMNGAGGAGLYGGVYGSIISVTEVKV